MKQFNAIELKQSAWYKQWFDSAHYHSLYSNRNDEEASNFIDRVMDWLQPAPGARMIDVGCGAGRHCRQLAKAGFDVIGIDLSLQSIRKARENEGPALRFYQHDMRKAFGSNHFDFVFNLFTSFGYFKNQAEHQLVINNHAQALKPGGCLVMDYMNPDFVVNNLIPIDKKSIDGVTYDIERWATPEHIFKRICITDPVVPNRMEHIEQVARFTLSDFDAMFNAAGLKRVETFGDYQLNGFDSKTSNRQIMVAVKQ